LRAPRQCRLSNGGSEGESERERYDADQGRRERIGSQRIEQRSVSQPGQAMSAMTIYLDLAWAVGLLVAVLIWADERPDKP
jgi:hypothetical protein